MLNLPYPPSDPENVSSTLRESKATIDFSSWLLLTLLIKLLDCISRSKLPHAVAFPETVMAWNASVARRFKAATSDGLSRATAAETGADEV